MTSHQIPPRLSTPKRRLLGYRNLNTFDDDGKNKPTIRSPLPRIRQSYQAMQRTTSRLCDLLSPKCSPVARRNLKVRKSRLLESTESVRWGNDGDESSLSSSLDSLTSIKLEDGNLQLAPNSEQPQKYCHSGDWIDLKEFRHNVSTINDLDPSNYSQPAQENSKLYSVDLEKKGSGQKSMNTAPPSPMLHFIIQKTLKVARSTPPTPKFNMKFFNRFTRGALANPSTNRVRQEVVDDNQIESTTWGGDKVKDGSRKTINLGDLQPNLDDSPQTLPMTEVPSEQSLTWTSPLGLESFNRQQAKPKMALNDFSMTKLRSPNGIISDGVSASEPMSQVSSPFVSTRIHSEDKRIIQSASTRESIAIENSNLKTIVLQKKHDTERFGMKLDRITEPHLCKDYEATQATYIAMILPQSPAHSAGLQAGDRILSVNHVPVENHPLTEVLDMIRATPTELPITYEPRPFKVFLLTMNVRKKDGRFGLRLDINHQDLRVDIVVPGSPAAQAGLRRGQKVMALNGKAVTGLDHDRVMKWLRAYPEDKSFSITVLEDNTKQTYTQAVTEFSFEETESEIDSDAEACRNGGDWQLEKCIDHVAPLVVQISDQGRHNQQSGGRHAAAENGGTVHTLQQHKQFAGDQNNQQVHCQTVDISGQTITDQFVDELQARATSFG